MRTTTSSEVRRCHALARQKLGEWSSLGQVNPTLSLSERAVFLGDRQRASELDGATDAGCDQGVEEMVARGKERVLLIGDFEPRCRCANHAGDELRSLLNLLW